MTEPGSSKETPSQGRILVVDDEDLVRDALAERIRREGYEVASADGGESAFRLLETQEFDVILLDLRMKDMDGIAALQELQRRRQPAEVVMLTAYPTIGTAVEALKLGALDYLLKPWKMPELSQKIRQAIEVKRQKEKGALEQTFDRIALEHDFTRKQVAVCKHLLSGMSNAQIAQTLDISENTVKSHLKRIFDKLGVESRTELLARILQYLQSQG